MSSYLKKAAAAVTLDGDWAEFGVASGGSARKLLDLMPNGSTFWAFDSWAGLPADWGTHKKGKFACDPPDLGDDRVRLMSGLFSSTIPTWEHGEQLALVHIDCDLEESFRDVLCGMGHLLGPGTILAIDDWDGASHHAGRKVWEECGGHGEELACNRRQVVIRCLGPVGWMAAPPSEPGMYWLHDPQDGVTVGRVRKRGDHLWCELLGCDVSEPLEYMAKQGVKWWPEPLVGPKTL